ncbi:MAG TPA: hypothetical protein VFS20_08665 [Longimicrobium sp.]|nr:hypothetical protein [Longimicrobium sp.]
MRKLKLQMESLKVDSFDTDGQGKVRGHDTMETEWCTGYPYCGVSRPKCQTPYDTCFGSCGCTEGCNPDTYNCG